MMMIMMMAYHKKARAAMHALASFALFAFTPLAGEEEEEEEEEEYEEEYEEDGAGGGDDDDDDGGGDVAASLDPVFLVTLTFMPELQCPPYLQLK